MKPDTRRKTLLLVTRLRRELSAPLIDRAVTVADRLGLNVDVLCPTVTAATAADSDARAASRTDDLALSYARKVAEAIQSRGITATYHAETCVSELEVTMAHASDSHAALIMVTADQYDDWADSLTQGRDLEQLDVPLWVQNDEPITEGIILGALAAATDASDETAMDEAIAMHTKRLADSFDTEAHLLHTIAPESAIHRASELVTTNAAVDSDLEQIEADCVSRAHATAEQWRIPREHVHVDSGKFAEEIATLAETMSISVVVMGASRRPLLTRLLSTSRQQSLLEQLRADILIVGR